jgi:filamentous hemagglutinin family protein
MVKHLKGFSVSLTLCLAAMFAPVSGFAQHITTDGSVGPRGTLIGPSYIIPAELGQTRGSNLFHSFNTFSVLTGESANFTGPNSIQTIFSRVTGGSVSSIDGALNSTIPGVSLFLLNPAGVLFGPSASINIGGAFRVSTANYVQFTDGYQFKTVLGNDGNFTSAPYAAFGFLGPGAAPITFDRTNLEVRPGQTLAVVGGDISLTGPSTGGVTLQAKGGEVQVVSVASAGEVPLVSSPVAPALSVNNFSALGAISLTNGAAIAAPSAVTNVTPGGRIVMRGGKLTLDQGSAVFASTGGNASAPSVALDIAMRESMALDHGSVITSTNTGGLGNGGTMFLTAADIELRNGAALNNFYASDGNGSDLMVNAGRFVLNSGATIIGKNTGARNLGNGGAIVITATESVTIGPGSSIQTENFQGLGTGSPITIATPMLTVEGAAGASGKAGITGITGGFGPASSVTLNVGTLELKGQQALIDTRARNVSVVGGTLPTEGGGAVTVQGQGGAGTLADLVRVSGQGSGFLTETEGAGTGGALTIAARQLIVENGGKISATTRGTGQGGTLSIATAGATTLTGAGSGLFSDATAGGNGGAITAEAGTMMIHHGASVSASSSGTGDAGSITIQTAGLFQITGGSVKTTAVTGTGGDITITAGEMALNGAVISASSQGPGDAGNITINSGTQFISTSSGVTTEAIEASGGNIALNARRMIRLTGSQVSTSVAGGPTTVGGNITIDPDFVIMQNSQIVAQAFQGQGGNITITAGTFLADPASLVDASSQLGVSGSVNIQAPVTNLSEAVKPLSDNPVDAAALVRASCAARFAGGDRSSLVQRGRDTLPADPGSGLMTGPFWANGGLVAAVLAELEQAPLRLLAREGRSFLQESQDVIRLDGSAVMEAAAYCRS